MTDSEKVPADYDEVPDDELSSQLKESIATHSVQTTNPYADSDFDGEQDDLSDVDEYVNSETDGEQ